MPTVKLNNLSKEVSGSVHSAIGRSQIQEMLVAQAKRRISAGGDSQVTYPDLWDHPKSYRRGGQPLRDTGPGFNGLHGTKSDGPNGTDFSLRTHQNYMVFQHAGFSTSGPNFIPLTRKAVRLYAQWSRAVRAKSKAKKRGYKKGESVAKAQIARIGLVQGEDYIMAWGGVNVPARPIFNLPPEDVREITRTIERAIKRA